MSLLPLANHRDGGAPVLYGRGPDVSASLFLAQAGRLARALPPGERVINLCETRHGFMVAFAAALWRGQVSLLPSARGVGDREALRRRHPGAPLLCEKPIEGADGFAIGDFLEDREDAPFGMPGIDSRAVAATLYTSGSTGEPAAHSKTWGQLCRGAAMLATALGWESRPGVAVVGSVPPQHMFGLESTVMLPWQAGVPVHAGQPLLAADLEAALGEGERFAWWMTTPALMRAPLQSGAALPRLDGIVASTMGLPPAIAQAAERSWRAPVIEVYGSTETGALATRRTAVESDWIPLEGVALRGEGEGEARRFLAEGPHIAAAVALGDLLELLPDGRFRWLGRAGDMVKIGGKRGSLAALGLALTGIPGVSDGVFACAPGGGGADEGSGSVRRLAAFYVSNELSPDQVLARLRERIDAAFLPRPIRRVARVPRDANGKATQATLEELFAMNPPAQVIAPDHPSLAGHFPGEPIVPGALLLARVATSLRASFPRSSPAELRWAHFHVPLRPGEPFAIVAWRKDGHARFEVRRTEGEIDRGAVIASGEWALDRCVAEGPAP